jgi:hypothetical protein
MPGRRFQRSAEPTDLPERSATTLSPRSASGISKMIRGRDSRE